MRTKATMFSFFLVCVLYFVYGWAVVPLVLPNSGGNDGRSVAASIAPDTTREEIEPYLELLPEDGWERDPSHEIHLLQFGQTIVLFGKDTIEGKLLRLQPCTILLLPNAQEYLGDEESQDRIRQSIVLRTQQYAEIEFDRAFDVSKLPLPKIETGRLFGKVTIKSDMKDPGKQDDLYLEAESIEIKETPDLTRIETRRDVRFNLGFHSGIGTGLVLEIVQSDPLQPQASKELSSAVFQKLQSLRLVFPEDPNVLPKLSGGVCIPDGPAATLDIHCQGRFEFAANPAEQGWTASFYQNVNMVRNNPDHTVDRLTAEEVHLTLKPINQAPGVAVTENKTSQFASLEPALFVAQGKIGQSGQQPIPARLSVKQGGDITLVGDEIFFDLRKNFLSLSTRKGAGASPWVEMIVAGQYTIRSEQCVQYTLGPNGAFGKFAADGKGSMIGKVGDGTSAKDIALEWNEMQMEQLPAVKDQVILKLGKGISARMTGFGTMKADSLDLYCNFGSANQTTTKLPGTGTQKNNLTLDQAIVKGNVLFETASGTCRVRQLNIFFTNVTADGKVVQSRWAPQMLLTPPPTVPGRAVAQQPIRQVQHLEPLTPQNTLAPMQPLTLYQPPVVTAPAPAYGSRMPSPQPQPNAKPTGFVETQNLLGIKSSPNGGKFDITGDLMKMQVRVQNGQSSAEIVAIEGNVRLKENASNNVPNTAIEIIGDTVTIWNPADPTTQINIMGQATGNDAIFKGKGIELRARELNLSRWDNTFWSPGSGQLIANTAQINAPGIPSGNSNDTKLIVEWNKEMICNGKVIIFSGQPDRDGNRVRILYQAQKLWCNDMEIWLNRQVMFFDDQSSVEPQAVEIRCAHDVYVRNEQFDPQGRKKSIDTARVANLQYNVERNYFVAEGPGEINSIFVGSGQGFDKMAPGNLAGTSGTGASGNSEKLNYLAVWFQDTIQGTLLGDKAVTIKGKVQAAYCPANSWNDTISFENFSAARKTGYTLECERLEITEMPNPVNLSQSFMELTASNDARIDSSEFYGRAQTIKYNQAKSLVQLDGNVKLHTASQGSVEAQSIQYNIESGTFNSVRLQGIGIGQ